MLLKALKERWMVGFNVKLVGFFLVGCFAVSIASPSFAANQYWVSLGSYSKLSGAEQLRNQASVSFSQLSIVEADSPLGLVYRVIDGPVDDRASANARLEEARIAGYPSAWLVIRDSSQGIPASVGSGSGAASSDYTDTSSTYESSSYETSSYETTTYDSTSATYTSPDYAPEESYSPATSYATEEYNNVQIGKQELVDEAPANYGLHRLNRDNGNIGRIGESADSRLRELYPEQDQN